jgi:hypothetical protein
MPSIRPLLAALTLSLPLLVAPAAQGAVVSGGQVDWGVKESFRNYVTGPFAGGDITTSDQASQNSGIFRFPITGGDEAAGTRVGVGTRGKVQFRGHYPPLSNSNPQLDLSIFNVRVVIDSGASGSCLVADVDSKKLNGGGTTESYRDIRLAKLDPTGPAPGNNTWTNVPATLTEEGAPVFGGQYEPGVALDPVTVNYTTGAGTGTAPSCQKRGNVVTVPPGATPPSSRPAGATLKLGKLSRSQLSSLARGKAIRTKVRVSQAGKVTLTAKGRIARRTRTAAKVAKRATKPGVVSLRWKLGKSARRELARKKKLKLKLSATLPGARKAATQSFTLKRR